jgi:hypothetical protein
MPTKPRNAAYAFGIKHLHVSHGTGHHLAINKEKKRNKKAAIRQRRAYDR